MITFLKGTSWPKEKKVDDYAKVLYLRDDIDCMCQEKEDENSSALKIA